MPNKSGKPCPGPLRPRTGAVKYDSGSKPWSKQPHTTTQTRKVVYRVGYNWNKGGRLKELRIRHLARKFLKIWIKNTFGRVLPHEAKSHYRRVILKKVFEAWQDQWWTSHKEWSLTLRAECHYRYSLYIQTFHKWRDFVALQREKKLKIQNAQSFANRHQLRHVWDRWEDFTEMKKIKKRNLETAFQFYKHSAQNSVWSKWQSRIQHIQDLYTLEDEALKQQRLTIQQKILLYWRDMHAASCHDRANETRASQHNSIRLKRKAFHQWSIYLSGRHIKSASKVTAQNTCNLRLIRIYWNKWCQVLYQKWSEEVRLEAAGHLAERICQRRVVNRWKAYVKLHREKATNIQKAQEHDHHRLLLAVLGGLSRNVHLNKTKRLNNNVAVQHYHQTITGKYWRLWQQRLEEAEDRSFQPLTEKAHTIYSISLSKAYFHYWRERLFELRHMQTMSHQADMLFAEHTLPRCFQSWFDLTRRKKLQKQRTVKAELYNRQRQFSGLFYTWLGLSEKHKGKKLAHQMAIFHEEHNQMQKAWIFWRERTKMRFKEQEKQKISKHLYQHRLLQKTLTQWKDSSAEIRDRRNRELQACHQGALCCLRWAVEKWKRFVQMQRHKKKRAEQMQQYHEVKLLKNYFAVWKKHTLQRHSMYAQAEDLHKQQTQKSLRRVLGVWQENAADFAEFRFKKQLARNHHRHVLQLEMFRAWRAATIHAVTIHHQQMEALSRAQQSINKGRLLHFFRQWQLQARNVQSERLSLQKAIWHHETNVLSKALKAWEQYHSQHQKYKVMKRQANLLFRLKIWQTFFDQWKLKLQHRRREARETEQALWHWSLTLQAKVLYAWRLYVTEQRQEREEVAQAAQLYRDQLLREGVSYILTYAAHMNDLTTSLTQHTQEQQSRRLQRVVRRCALKWKHRALCKKDINPEVKSQQTRKSVSFLLPEIKCYSSEAEDRELMRMLHNRMPQRQPRFSEELLKSPPSLVLLESSDINKSVASPEIASQPPDFTHIVTSTHQGLEAMAPFYSNASSKDSKPNQELLLPPSAFMTTPSQSPEDPIKQLWQPIPPANNDNLNSTAVDPVSGLTYELLRIKQDMKGYQQDKKQLRAWCKLKDVLQTWLQTSGQDDQAERNAVSQELEELEKSIIHLTTEISKQKPTMLQHVERIQQLQVTLHASFSNNPK